jgi:polyhydroxyalkanoate synthase subunit PhaC
VHIQSGDGYTKVWLDPVSLAQSIGFDASEAARLRSRQKGVLEGHELAQAFAWLRPNDLIWPYWVNNYLLGEDPRAFDILYWNNDTTNLPARLHSDFLDLLGSTIDLSAVGVDTYVLAGVTDHITPWRSCYATTQTVGGRCEFVLSSSGHVQSIINPLGNPKASLAQSGAHEKSGCVARRSAAACGLLVGALADVAR